MKKTLRWLFENVLELSSEEAAVRIERYEEKHWMRKIAFCIGLPTFGVAILLIVSSIVLILWDLCGVISLDLNYSMVVSVIGWLVVGATAVAIILDLIGRTMKSDN